ncbi:DNA damage-inducible protein I, partial [Escherichia coli]|nr:DNA damage-inducible protein I [Escherichia coli]
MRIEVTTATTSPLPTTAIDDMAVELYSRHQY